MLADAYGGLRMLTDRQPGIRGIHTYQVVSMFEGLRRGTCCVAAKFFWCFAVLEARDTLRSSEIFFQAVYMAENTRQLTDLS